MCNVSCTWYQPSKIATLEFTSSQSMEEAAQKLGKIKILNRTLEYVERGLRSTPASNCDVWREFLLFQRRSDWRSYTEAVILYRNRRGLDFAHEDNRPQIKATATFSTMEQAAKAVTELNGYKLPQLGGSKILLSHMVKAKFSILSSIYTAISSELASVQQSLHSKSCLEIKSYIPTNLAQRFTTLHIISNTAQEVGKAKAAVEKILNGHTARGGRGTVWNELFLKPEGIAYLNDLGKQHKVFIYRNARKCILSLYGNEENRAIVESALIKTVEDLAVSTFSIDLDDKVPVAALQDRYRKIVGKLGKTAARLNVTTSPKTITIHGSSQDADWAKATLQEESDYAIDTRTNVEENLTCTVCWCDVEESASLLLTEIFPLDA
ncbi:hypothetical protein MMC19_005657 [Ptychographa xylographoides]|nr:hypothetical protein [Ptychographa xylographoides]